MAVHNIARLKQVIRCLFIVEQQQLMNRHAISYKPIRDDFCTPNAIPSVGHWQKCLRRAPAST